MSVEKRIATKLRQALDTAYGKGELARYWPFSKFPYDCCEHTCDILGYLLSEEGINSIGTNVLEGCDQVEKVYVGIDYTQNKFGIKMQKN